MLAILGGIAIPVRRVLIQLNEISPCIIYRAMEYMI